MGYAAVTDAWLPHAADLPAGHGVQWDPDTDDDPDGGAVHLPLSSSRGALSRVRSPWEGGQS
jgi:hypothetical protein